MFKIYINNAAGLSFTGIIATTETEAKELCKKFNEQDAARHGGYNPYSEHIYKPA